MRANPGRLVRDQPLAGELAGCLREADVSRRQDHVGALERIVVELRALRAHIVQQLGEGAVETVLTAPFDDRHDLVLKLVQALGVGIFEPVLVLAGYAHDHRQPPASPERSAAPGSGSSPPPGASAPAGAGAEICGAGAPWPSSAFILARSSSTAGALDSCLSWRAMSSSPPPSWVRSSKVPAASSSDTASARARMFSVLSTARCIARPTSAICSPTPVAASEIRTWASAAEYWALMTSFLVRHASILPRSFCSESVSFCCWSSSSVTCVSSPCSSVWATFLRSSAVRARSSWPAATAWRAWVSSLTTLWCRELSCLCRRVFAVTTSAMPFLTFCSCSTCFW